jgi:hypothetical protein
MRFMVIVKATKDSEAGGMPSEQLLGDSEIEIRQVFEAEDFGAEFTPELRERERAERVYAQVSSKK